ncbi:MAG: zinc-ribbon and DUF3426 domain-containing protein [Gammaproteobacteria bacterium]|nr:zinc-ribbon and DUF3426 domain-containing protein [Gammaproteobacteria bacterium]
MYTRCPHCLTLFVVGADQLKAAHGNVRCGTCLESFDAIPYLSDGPVDPGDAPQVQDTASVADMRSAAARLSSTLDALGVAGVSTHERPPESDDTPDTGGVDDTAFDWSADTDDEPEAETESPSRADDGALDDGRGRDAGSDVDLEIPEILREQSEEQSARRAARRRNIGYGAAAVALLALLAFQYLFFNPEDAAARYPQWRGAIESMCERIGCVLPERRDASRIRVLSRDVRVHPRYEGVLQIKATLANAAPFRQPYPRVRFTLFNVNGQTIATRVFQPSEYLGRNVSASARLRPRTPFQIALDVLAPEEAAVSFEFQFL